MHLGAEQVDPLPTGDLRVQAELARDAADGDQLLRGDLASRDSRNDGIRSVLLHVGEVVIVRVLQRRALALQNETVPAGSENRSHRGLADIAPEPTTVFREYV